MKTYTLNNGIEIPAVGFGTWRARDEECYQAVVEALKAGYRHIDTAAFYENEEVVGRAIKDSGIPREELFVTTKLWNTVETYDEAKQALATSLKKLQLDYVDLYLIHWPNPKALRDRWQNRNAQVWQAMEEAYKEGLVRSIGVSNFLVHHLEELAKTATVLPVVNQIKIGPGVYQEEVIEYCRNKNILLEAWRPLGKGEVFEHETMQLLAQKYQCTIAQLALAWSLQEGFAPLPKSVTPARIRENLACFGIEITAEDAQTIRTIQGVTGADNPDTIDL